MLRLAWFSPLPPVRSGIAQYNWDLLSSFARSHQIDLFADGLPGQFQVPGEGLRVFSAYDFLWMNRYSAYDVIVYQLGNAPCHDYLWAYLVRYPGLVVLHDGQLHHARGRMLLQQWQPKQDDYRHEFWFNHPDAHKDLAELGAAGLLGSLTYLWPMLRIVVESSRRILVHNEWLAAQIRDAHPGARVGVVEMGVPKPSPRADARARIRVRHNLPDDAVVFTAFGKVTPEKRVREAIHALSTLADVLPNARILLAGENVEYYDMPREAELLGIGHKVTAAGYVGDEEIDDYLVASDVCLCMRWPTSRETSASWLRCLAAGKPTISTDLAHTVDIPTLDPRNWSARSGLSSSVSVNTAPVGISIDILDEAHSLKLALRRLASDEKLRGMLGANARELWRVRFQLESMVAGYAGAIEDTIQTPVATAAATSLPQHLRSTGTEQAEALLQEVCGLSSKRSVFGP
jgi:glycosyltransferase involved in cell wall biosynthesis